MNRMSEVAGFLKERMSEYKRGNALNTKYMINGHLVEFFSGNFFVGAMMFSNAKSCTEWLLNN